MDSQGAGCGKSLSKSGTCRTTGEKGGGAEIAAIPGAEGTGHSGG